MTIAVGWDVKPQTKQTEYHYILTSFSSGTQAGIAASNASSEASGTNWVAPLKALVELQLLAGDDDIDLVKAGEDRALVLLILVEMSTFMA